MKTKFYCLLIILLSSIVLVSCDIEYSYSTKYIYINDTSEEINVVSTMPGSGKTPDYVKEFTVLPGQETIIWFEDEGDRDVDDSDYRKPLSWSRYLESPHYSTVSNGIVVVTEKREDNTELYDQSNYTAKQIKKNAKAFTYTFTDAYFENGEPIE